MLKTHYRLSHIKHGNNGRKLKPNKYYWSISIVARTLTEYNNIDPFLNNGIRTAGISFPMEYYKERERLGSLSVIDWYKSKGLL